MEHKILVIADRATFIPVLTIDMNPSTLASHMYDPTNYVNERKLLRRVGYSCNHSPIILLTHLSGGKSSYDPHSWGDRTYATAHKYITENWHLLKTGDVVDVECVLGETPNPRSLDELIG